MTPTGDQAMNKTNTGRVASGELIARIETAGGGDNALDVLVEIALFEPDDLVESVRANAAGTKVIYRSRSGGEATHWPPDWTRASQRQKTVAALRSRLTK